MNKNKLGFGLMRLPLKNKDDQSSIDMDVYESMADKFLENGFTYFDTAYMYHDHKSEPAFKEAVVKRHARDSFTITSKMPLSFLKTKENQARIFDEQLSKCGVEYFDYYLLHNYTRLEKEKVKSFGTFEFVSQMKKEGKIRHIGFSCHDDAATLDEALTQHPEVEVVQLQLNYLDWESCGIQSRKCYETAQKHGKRVIVMEPVKGGTLANIPPEAEKLFRNERPDDSPASWALRFAAGLDDVMMVLSGMSNLAQMEDNIRSMKNLEPLSQHELDVVEKVASIINASVAIPCTACRYCVEGCPKKIAIPTYFALYNAEKTALNTGFSTHWVYYQNYAKNNGKASDCIGCGKCEKICPQHLKIRDCLKEVAKAFEK